MWRSYLRLRDGGRRLLNRLPGGPKVFVGLGSNTPSPSRAYVPPTGEGGKGTPTPFGQGLRQAKVG